MLHDEIVEIVAFIPLSAVQKMEHGVNNIRTFWGVLGDVWVWVVGGWVCVWGGGCGCVCVGVKMTFGGHLLILIFYWPSKSLIFLSPFRTCDKHISSH